MKKEFKAPIVDTRELSALNNIMVDGVLTISTDKAMGEFTLVNDETAADDFKQWKGFKAE